MHSTKIAELVKLSTLKHWEFLDSQRLYFIGAVSEYCRDCFCHVEYNTPGIPNMESIREIAHAEGNIDIMQDYINNILLPYFREKDRILALSTH